MKNCYKLEEINGKSWFIKPKHHYSKISESKEVYLSANEELDKKDDSILIEIGDREKHILFTCSVEETERFALALLILCNAIKY